MSNFFKNKRVTITGGQGFLGQVIKKKLEIKGCKKISIVKHGKYDLVKMNDVKRMYRHQKPDIVFHLAATVGGIGINKKNPGKFFYENAMMNLQVIHQGYLNDVKKIISAGSVSSYPANTPLPFNEKNLWKGFPEDGASSYGIAKRIIHTQSSGYKEQYNFNSVLVLLTNLYGPNDNFNPKSSHVIASLIKKFHEAKIKKKKKVIVWGSGNATRDFIFVEDAADGIILAAEKYNHTDPVNLASGKEIKIRELAFIIKENIGFKGKIVWDSKMPTGPKRRVVDISKAKKEFGFNVKTSMLEGIKKTLKWYTKK
tara:strand:- start:5494 stop:6429 length:936 start_codon:yes stop_codon:yes gene_type:complete